MEPQRTWNPGYHLHWDNTDGWIQVLFGDYCRVCDDIAVCPASWPDPGDPEDPGTGLDEDGLTCLRCILGPDVCTCGLRQDTRTGI